MKTLFRLSLLLGVLSTTLTIYLLANTLNTVPVLAEPTSKASMVGEARGSTATDRSAVIQSPGNNSRGGVQSFISPAEMYARLLDEGRVPWSEPTPIPGNKR